mmetsp:Transcript_16039/g.45930  ORF Transcript_16039/g.45930 Transcript_16039/m.45930 type:complete len:240 (+) Transcript_16039:1875-2594(+)
MSRSSSSVPATVRRSVGDGLITVSTSITFSTTPDWATTSSKSSTLHSSSTTLTHFRTSPTCISTFSFGSFPCRCRMASSACTTFRLFASGLAVPATVTVLGEGDAVDRSAAVARSAVFSVPYTLDITRASSAACSARPRRSCRSCRSVRSTPSRPSSISMSSGRSSPGDPSPPLPTGSGSIRERFLNKDVMTESNAEHASTATTDGIQNRPRILRRSSRSSHTRDQGRVQIDLDVVQGS